MRTEEKGRERRIEDKREEKQEGRGGIPCSSVQLSVHICEVIICEDVPHFCWEAFVT